jgi:D-arabinose 1-dehydrogenase-like Zn-dependent alcohol dehydrogenase
MGVNRAGAYASHVLVPHPKYLVDSAGVDDAFAATLACSGLTTYSAAAKLPELGPKDWVAVIGCGGLGLVAISVLRARGVKNIIGCDVDESKLTAAKAQGAKLTLDTRTPDAVQKLQALAMGQLAGAIDLVGMPTTAMLALGALRKGGRYVICGLFGGEITHPLPPFAQRAIGLVGSYVGNLKELKEVVALAKKRKLKPTPVSTRPAVEVNAILEDLKAGKVLGRVVLAF